MGNSAGASYQKPGGASPASVVSDAVLKIISTDKPETRYRVCKFAKLLVWMRNYLGDKTFDNIILSQVK